MLSKVKKLAKSMKRVTFTELKINGQNKWFLFETSANDYCIYFAKESIIFKRKFLIEEDRLVTVPFELRRLIKNDDNGMLTFKTDGDTPIVFSKEYLTKILDIHSEYYND